MVIHHAQNTISGLLLPTLLLTLLGDVHRPATAVHLVKTSEWSVAEISLPDEQTVHLYFWMEGLEGEKGELEGGSETGPGGYNECPVTHEEKTVEEEGVVKEEEKKEEEEEEEEEEELEVMEDEEDEEEGEDEGPLVMFNAEEKDEEGEDRRRGEDIETEKKGEDKEDEVIEETTTAYEEEKATEITLVQNGVKEEQERQDQGATVKKRDDNLVTLSYTVSHLQYPGLTFPLPQRNMWFDAHFEYDRVTIPVTKVVRHPQPSSWWGRKVRVSSGSTVYWHLCTSTEICTPGSPKSIMQEAKRQRLAAKNPRSVWGTDRVLMVVFGAGCGVLLPACLGLLAIVCTLRRRRPSQRTASPSHSCRYRPSPHRRHVH